jgi:heme oxygenase
MPAHLALESRIGPLATQSAYNEYLIGMTGFRSAVEAWLGRHGADAWRTHELHPALQQDVSDLALKASPTPSLGWGGADEAFSMGVHYVLEGSALGARVLCKQVAPLGLHRGFGARHLWAQAERQDFRSFLTLLSARASALSEARIIAGADAAFTAAADAMECAAHA